MLDKVEISRLKMWQNEINMIVAEFRQALIKHFEIVETKSRNLINSKWDNEEDKSVINN